MCFLVVNVSTNIRPEQSINNLLYTSITYYEKNTSCPSRENTHLFIRQLPEVDNLVYEMYVHVVCHNRLKIIYPVSNYRVIITI